MSPTPNSFAGAECYKGSDINGAQFYVALPGKWNNSYESLVIYAPGGPGPTSAGSHSIEADALPVKRSLVAASPLRGNARTR